MCGPKDELTRSELLNWRPYWHQLPSIPAGEEAEKVLHDYMEVGYSPPGSGMPR